MKLPDRRWGFGKPTDWASAKAKISEANFLTQVKTFDKDNISNAVVNKIRKGYVEPRLVPSPS